MALRVHIYPTFEKHRINSIRSADVEAWCAKLPLADGNSKRTTYNVLRAIFTAAVRDSRVSRSPCTLRLRSRPKDEAPLIALSVAQVQAISAHAPDRCKAPF